MTVTDKPTDHHADLWRLLDAGYEITFKLPPYTDPYAIDDDQDDAEAPAA